MAPIDLNRLRPFIAVYEGGSFTAAARRLGVPRSTVSRAVAALEEAMGATFFHRDTRNVAITAEGRRLYDRIAPALAGLEQALADPMAGQEGPSGTLRLTTTADLATMVLAEAVARYTTRYPGTRVELHLTYRLVDLLREGFDVGIRAVSRGLRGASLVARRLGPLALGLYASPELLARQGVPRTSEDLRAFDWVVFGGAASLPIFSGAGSPLSHAQAQSRVVCDDAFFAREAVRLGLGVGALPAFIAADDLTRGSLVRVLPSLAAQIGTLYFVHPARRHVPARVTAFRDLLLELLRQRPLTPA